MNTKTCLAIRNAPIPVVAQVNGAVMAGGLQIMSACDMVIASNMSNYSCAGIKLGLYCSTPAVPFVRSARNWLKMFEFLTTGSVLNAQQALELGIINQIIDDNGNRSQMDAEALKFVARILKHDQKSIQIAKRYIYLQTNPDEGTDTDIEKLLDTCDGGDLVKSPI